MQGPNVDNNNNQMQYGLHRINVDYRTGMEEVKLTAQLETQFVLHSELGGIQKIMSLNPAFCYTAFLLIHRSGTGQH